MNNQPQVEKGNLKPTSASGHVLNSETEYIAKSAECVQIAAEYLKDSAE